MNELLQDTQLSAAASGRSARDPYGAPQDRVLLRLGAIAGAAGVLVQIVADQLHPAQADPNDSRAAFAEYSHSRIWIAVHLGQFLGTVLLAVALLSLARALSRQRGLPGALALVGAFTTVLLSGLRRTDGPGRSRAPSRGPHANSPTVVLLPTWAIAEPLHWKGQVPSLARWFRVITVHGRGSGRSGRPVEAAAYTQLQHAADQRSARGPSGTTSSADMCPASTHPSTSLRERRWATRDAASP